MMSSHRLSSRLFALCRLSNASTSSIRFISDPTPLTASFLRSLWLPSTSEPLRLHLRQRAYSCTNYIYEERRHIYALNHCKL
ncbi:hypothetical protein BDV98DRAFT_575247 [Pterulicium gracile]|uniref:Uncharacterized protein n=1 Tax=Pterulicium gracile TaxID=1884261 RepID=A0A5C3Q9B5_9AGAR|nr:hypothetical protein BDV98DRAFT_575247 [Pterula gracilis]